METGGDSVRYPVNKLAAALPVMQDHEYEALKADIWENGLREPIAILDGEIVDGRHRERACRELGMEPKYEYLPADTDPLKYIISKNRHRRNMNPSQSAIAAARIYLLSLEVSQQDSGSDERAGSESAILQGRALTESESALLFGVSDRTFGHALSVMKSNPPNSLEVGVDQGKIAVSDADKVIGQPHELQEAAAKMVLEGEVRTVKSAVNRILKEKDNRVEPEASSAESWQSSNGRAALHNCSLASLTTLVEKQSVDTIIGHPPQGDDVTKTLIELRDFMVHALNEDGLAILLCRSGDLPEVFRHLPGKGIQFLCELDYRVDLPTRPLGGRHEMTLSRMPLLVFGKAKSILDEGDDVIQLPPLDDASTEVRIGERHAAGANMIVRRFAVSGGLVCDPLLIGGAINALAAVRNRCRFLGASADQSRFAFVRDRLGREYEQRVKEGGSYQETAEAKMSAESNGRQLSLDS